MADMALESFRVSTVLPVSARRLYDAWLDAEEHAGFTGGAASVEARVGGKHTAWDGYIEGKILDLVDGERIVQSWRTAEFPRGAPDSRIEVLLREVETGTEIAIVHIDIPEGQGARYQSGWVEHYFDPMRDYFARGGAAASKPATSSAKSAARMAPKPKKSPPKKTAATAKKNSTQKKSAKKVVKAKSAAKKKSASKKKSAPKKTAVAKKAPAKKKTKKKR
jgi:uncharacterized protein YndB with AHSA1/START domain